MDRPDTTIEKEIMGIDHAFGGNEKDMQPLYGRKTVDLGEYG